jgi:multidrug resistance protein, MATE family
MTAREVELGSNGGGLKEIWLIAYPLILVNASNTIMTFTDRKFLSMHSTIDVAAALPAGILCFTLFSFFMMTASFTSAIVSQYYGRGEKDRCAQIIWTSFFFALFAGILCSYLMPVVGEFIIKFGNHSPDVFNKEMQYFKTLMPSGGFSCVMAVFCSFFSGRGKTIVVAMVSFGICGINCILNYTLIFGKFGFPALGIAGAGVATTLSQAFGALLIFAVFLCQNQNLYPTRKIFYKFSDLRRLISFGAPSGLQVFCDVGAFTFVIFLMGSIGDTALAVTTIAMSINMLAFMPLLGMSQATSIITGLYIGKNRKDISEKQAYLSLKVSLLYILIISMIFVIFPEPFFNFFSPEADAENFREIIDIGRAVLLCAAAYNFFDALYFISIGALRGAGDTQFPMRIIIIFSWTLLVPGMLLCVFVFKVSVVGAWAYIAAYVALMGTIIFMRFRNGKWKNINMIDV